MSYYGHGQNGIQHPQGQQQLVRQATGNTGAPGVIPSQLFGQLQFTPSANANAMSFPDPNSANHIQILHQQQQQSSFQNINFLTEQLTAGVGQIISHATQNPTQTIAMQNLISPMSMTNLTSVGFAPSLQVTQTASTTSSPSQQKQRVFTGTVTKTHDNFGFIDEEVFFQMGCVKGPVLPKAGDRVLVEADFNSAMPFKWNATRVQIVNLGGGITNMSSSLNPGGKSQSPQPNSQHLQQHMHPNFQIHSQGLEKRSQGLVAPPPPILSGVNTSRQSSQANMTASSSGPNYSQVSIISNPHSIYTQQTGSGLGGGGSETSRGIQMPPFQQTPRPPNRGRDHIPSLPMQPDPLMGHSSQYQGMQQLYQPSSARSPIDDSMELASKKKRERDHGRNIEERDRERDLEKDRERERREKERERDREREREKDREREREKDREREREREREKDREREREKERRRSPATSNRSKGREDLKRHISSRDKDKSHRNHSPSPTRSRKRSRSRDKDKDSDIIIVKDSHESKNASTDKSRSPSRKNRNNTARYSIEVPQHSLDTLDMNVMEVKRRYAGLYIPSDFFLAKATWTESFPAYQPLDLTISSPIHVFRRYIDKIDMGTFERENEADIELKLTKLVENPEPLDASQVFTAKVVLMSLPGKSLYRKTCSLAGDSSSNASESAQQLNRLINFVVGAKTGKNETMLIGGPWSPDLDGLNPHTDPEVLINTAVRTCKSLTGVDLKQCKKWYRMMELYYRRSNGNVETVVVFLPDISVCLPSSNDWPNFVQTYRVAMSGQDKVSTAADDDVPSTSEVDPGTMEAEQSGPMPAVVQSENYLSSENTIPDLDVSTKTDKVDQTVSVPADPGGPEFQATKSTGAVAKMEVDSDAEPQSEHQEAAVCSDTSGTGDTPAKDYDSSFEFEATLNESKIKIEAQLLEPKNMNVIRLREELALRGLNAKGLKPQLITRLVKAIKAEQEQEALSLETQPAEASESIVTPDAKNDSLHAGTTQSLTSIKSEPQFAEININPKAGEGSNDDSLMGMGHDTSSSGVRTVQPVLNTEITIESSEHALENETGEGAVKVPDVNPKRSDVRKPQVLPGILVPILTLGIDEKTRKIWERRYTLPKRPHILVHPSKFAKNGDFDCVQMTLASLKDYRSSDMKEQAFEVSLFAEFFHDMLRRDFAFRIYYEMMASSQTKTATNGMQPVDGETSTVTPLKAIEVKSSSDSPDVKKRKLSSASSSGTVQKGEESPKLKTVDPNLLLSFTFFDPTRCGYFTENDLEELCLSLGFGLSRSQLRKAIRKVAGKGNFNYRTLTDKPLSEVEGKSVVNVFESNRESMKVISKGNLALFPIFAYSKFDAAYSDNLDSPKDGFEDVVSPGLAVVVDGETIDVRKLKDQVDKYNRDRLTMDASLNVMKSSLNEAKNQVTDLRKTNETLKGDLLRTKESLKKQELEGKSNLDDLVVFRRASERFCERIQELIQIPVKDKDKELKLPCLELEKGGDDPERARENR